ncbi:MAG: class I SAM-dependent methyltransferase [Candidatus Omnitrophota bacterium]
MSNIHNEDLVKIWEKHWQLLKIDEDSIFNNQLDCWAEPHKKILDKYLGRLEPNSIIVNAGCGLGQWVFYSYKKGFCSIGLDIARDTITRLNHYISSKGMPLPRIQFIEDDIRDIKHIKNDFCDLILSFGVLEHFEDNIAVLEQFYKILKKGGYVIITVPNLYSTLAITKPILKLLGLWALGMQKHYSGKALRKIIPPHKFEIIEEGTMIYTELFGSSAKRIPVISHTISDILQKISNIVVSHYNFLGFMRFIVVRKL